jgi:hypothetical protein
MFKVRLYPRGDSNSHAVASASPSSWCVYQFRHLGILCCKYRFIPLILSSHRKLILYDLVILFPLRRATPDYD